MKPVNITPQNAVFTLLSFEGPDVYSQAGGLGARVTNLSQTLTQLGFLTHLFFIGDPQKSGEEVTNEGRLLLHRWCQWISERYPLSVYEGESEKLSDFTRSLPDFLTEKVIKPAARDDKMVIVLGEEWQTAEAMCHIGDQLRASGLADRAVMFWNANNTFGFDQINWERLGQASTLTTVSRYMKRLMQGIGLNPLIIPNGIPSDLLNQVDPKVSATLRTDLSTDLVLCKIARWDPSKGWDSAIEATARLKASGRKVVLLARGGTEPYGEEVLDKARSLGLRIQEVGRQGDVISDNCAEMPNAGSADMLYLRSHCPQGFLRNLYHASDAVLANSSHEPFGLVGLETMAAGGVAYTGGTGEDYAIPFRNSIVLETSSPEEIETYIIFLQEHPTTAERIRKAGRRTARQYTWERVIEILIRKLEYQARIQGLLAPYQPARASEPDELERRDSRRAAPGVEFEEVCRLVKQIKQETVLKDKAAKFLAEVPREYAFWNHDGRIFRSLHDLLDGLTSMSDLTFIHHANAHKNDFSVWIRNVIRDDKLAYDLERAHNLAQAASIVGERLALLNSRVAET